MPGRLSRGDAAAVTALFTSWRPGAGSRHGGLDFARDCLAITGVI
jgi:hypothetical protein